jgi:acetyltransferase-like isoleucine patch superfamily enzyme
VHSLQIENIFSPELSYKLKFQLRLLFAYLRGRLLTSLKRGFNSTSGRIYVGGRTEILIADLDAKLELCKSSNFLIDQNNPPYNPYSAESVQIGIPSHWRSIDPAQSRNTRIRIYGKATIKLYENTFIAPGVYITASRESILSVGAHSYISHDTQINCRSSISIGKGCLIANRVLMMDYDGHPIISSGETFGEDTFGGKDAPITIGDNVWIGHGAMIFKGVTIGEGAIVGAGACVRKNVPPNSIVVGNPATVIKEGVTWRKY